uniref:DUF488 domain-containing protein n=1 Tax=Eiseniibacteriota bacterium TaxID=2212470 RepID=A0A832MIP3_UNCEI
MSAPPRGRAAPDLEAPVTVFTVGHSTLTMGEFLALLAAHGVRGVADVRAVPRSRRHPQFEREALAAALAAAGVAYAHLPGLGGRRTPRPASPHTALTDPALRGYADHMATATFAAEVERLLALAAQRPTAALCAEADAARCHRSLLADALLARGARVTHLLGPAAAASHRLHPAARIAGGIPVYDGAALRLPGL